MSSLLPRSWWNKGTPDDEIGIRQVITHNPDKFDSFWLLGWEKWALDVPGWLSNEILWKIRKNSIEWADDKHMRAKQQKHIEVRIEKMEKRCLNRVPWIDWCLWEVSFGDVVWAGSKATPISSVSEPCARDRFPSLFVVFFLSPSQSHAIRNQMVLWPTTTFWSIKFWHAHYAAWIATHHAWI